MDDVSFIFNKQLELDVLINGLTEITQAYVDKHIDREILQEVAIPKGVTRIGDWAFANCKYITNITIPDSVTTIGQSAFADCDGLKTVTIPDSVTQIDIDAFLWCSGLRSITIGKGVTEIGDSAFHGCMILTNVMFKGKTMNKVKAMRCYPWGIHLDFLKYPRGISSEFPDIIQVS